MSATDLLSQHLAAVAASGGTTVFPSVMPQVAVLKQSCPTEEKYTKHGVLKKVHVVVKNTPFVFNLGLSNNVLYNQVIDFNRLTLEARLIYDPEDGVPEKEVDFVKSKPLEYKSQVSTERSDQAVIQLRIKVLSSQHEDMFFRIKFHCLDPRTGQDFNPPLFCISAPIKVISKPEQLKKKKSNKAKRTLNDMLVETINRIERQQQEQQRLIELLLAHQAGNAVNFDQNLLTISQPDQKLKQKKSEDNASLALAISQSMNSPSSSSSEANSDDESPKSPTFDKEEIKEEEASFQGAFIRFIASYNSLSPEEKPAKIRKVIRTTSTRDTEKLAELIDYFSTEGLQREIGTEIGQKDCDPTLSSYNLISGPTCGCKNCPHRLELARIDDFYNEFLSAPLPSLGLMEDS